MWGGIEPPTQGFSVLCSTDWATAPNFINHLRLINLLYPDCHRDLVFLTLLRRVEKLRPTELPHHFINSEFQFFSAEAETALSGQIRILKSEIRNRGANIGRFKINMNIYAGSFRFRQSRSKPLWPIKKSLSGFSDFELKVFGFIFKESIIFWVSTYIPYSLRNFILMIFSCSQLKLWSDNSSWATCNDEVSQVLK